MPFGIQVTKIMKPDEYHALAELFELCEEAMGYTPDYFRQKWEMDKRLDDLEQRLTRILAAGALLPKVEKELET